jgi:hypothetical protein
MRLTRVLFPLLAVAALATMTGCDLFGKSSVVIGSIISPNYQIPEGTPYHVVLYSADTTMDPWSDYDTVARVKEIEGTFPEPGLGADYDTINYQIDKVDAALYSMFAWTDMDSDGSFDPYVDYFGFHTGSSSSTDIQPFANVVVPESGVVDIDIWIDDFYVPAF